MSIKEKDVSFYDTHYKKQYSSIPEDSSFFRVWDAILKRISPEERIVDFGCGNGLLAKLAFKRELNYIAGIDFSEEAIKKAIQFNTGKEDTFIKDTLYNESIYNKFEFDVAIFCEVLEHIDDDIKVISWIKSNTHLLISLPSYDSLAHVRHFSSPDDITERYENQIVINAIEKIQLNGNGNRIYILDGLRRNNET